MFVPLLIVTFVVSLAACYVAGRLFHRPITAILTRIIGEELRGAWQRYIAFAIYVVGISGGVRIWDLEKYITPHTAGGEPLVLNSDHWTLEIYRTIIQTLQSIACSFSSCLPSSLTSSFAFLNSFTRVSSEHREDSGASPLNRLLLTERIFRQSVDGVCHGHQHETITTSC